MSDDLNTLRDEVALTDVDRWMARHADIFEIPAGRHRYCLTDADLDRLQADLNHALARRIEAARAEAEESARTAWAVHSEHVEYMNRLLMHREAVAEERGLAEGEARVRARVEALVSQWPLGDNGQDYRRAVTQCAAAVRAALAETTGREGGGRAKGGLIAPRADVMPFLQGGIDCYVRPGGPETATEPIGGVSGDSQGADEGTGAL